MPSDLPPEEVDHETATYYRTDMEDPQFMVKIMGVEVTLNEYVETCNI